MNLSQDLVVAPRSHPLHQERWCLVCGTALAGPLGALFRVFGIRRSSRNPNICSRCNTHQVADNADPHRSWTATGARLFIVD